LFTSAYFEPDTFQDLNLRTALAAGPGYQLLDKGTFRSPYVNEMQLYGEAGIGYSTIYLMMFGYSIGE